MAHSGGAGKVYFVLYLAVVLELLIIIVERDEAEEGLFKKQRETMRIVESILSQLYSGSGSEGINTRPQDEITIPPAGVNIKELLKTDIQTWRQYTIEVGVTDVSQSLKKMETENEKEYYLRLFELADRSNVEDLEYQLFFHPSEDAGNAPTFPSQDELIKAKADDFSDIARNSEVPGSGKDGVQAWKFLGFKKLVLNKDRTKDNLDVNNISVASFEPFYTQVNNDKARVGDFAPENVSDSLVFCYSQERTFLANSIASRDSSLKKRAFVVNFQPPRQAGWYKLRFVSHTNQILGVRKEVDPLKLDEESTINIGSVKLKVKDLLKVQKELQSKLEEYTLPPQEVLLKDPRDFDALIDAATAKVPQKQERQEIVGQIRLYRYISKLLAPGAYRDFDQNRGAIEFNVRVITPPSEKSAEPVITVNESYLNRFDAAKDQAFKVSISPDCGAENKLSGQLLDYSGTPISGATVNFTDDFPSKSGDVLYKVGHISGYYFTIQDGQPKEYKLRLTHSIGTKTKDTTYSLTIFPSVVASNNDELKGYFEGRASYGKKFFYSFQPSSGKKIPESQFKFYTKLDNTVDSVQGYVFPESKNFLFPGIEAAMLH